MNKDILKKHIRDYLAALESKKATVEVEMQERQDRVAYYQGWTEQRLRKMTKEDLSEYIAKLWAMRIWGNKQYVVDELLKKHGLDKVRDELAMLVWSKDPIEKRWDAFRAAIKGMGPAMMSELLCHVHPDKYMLWNRRVYVALDFLGVKDLPRFNYQLTGKKYEELCNVIESIAVEMRAMGVKYANLLTVDFFIWEELQVEENLSRIKKPQPIKPDPPAPINVDIITAAFIHDEIRDKIADIGSWLGLSAETEKKVAQGAVVDTVWQATIGNMGRVIYVFEVQTKGSHDSLVLNLLRSLNNPAVQGVVAVSDQAQLEKIKGEAAGVAALKDKLKYWDYQNVLKVHEALESVSESINSLGLVPLPF